MHVVATAGHVDHGKSTLVLALTGTDPDRLAEEKARGLTIDLGFAGGACRRGREYAIVDVPGHERFLKNMLAGVGAIDACMFVVAAPEGWKPQSEEHLRILELLGVQHGLVALTKVGLVDDELRELAHLELEDRLAGTFLASAEVVDVDAAGRHRRRRAARSRSTDSLAATPQAVDRDRPRLWIDRSFAPQGRRDRRHRNAGRRQRWRSATSSWSSTTTGPVPCAFVTCNAATSTSNTSARATASR